MVSFAQSDRLGGKSGRCKVGYSVSSQPFTVAEYYRRYLVAIEDTQNISNDFSQDGEVDYNCYY